MDTYVKGEFPLVGYFIAKCYQGSRKYRERFGAWCFLYIKFCEACADKYKDLNTDLMDLLKYGCDTLGADYEPDSDFVIVIGVQMD